MLELVVKRLIIFSFPFSDLTKVAK